MVIATIATGAVGLGALGLVEAATALGKPALAGTITVGTWVATGAGLPLLRLRFRDRDVRGCRVQRIPYSHRRRWWLAGGLHALWIDAMAVGVAEVVGPWGMAGILVGGTAALSARWMREHKVELPVDIPPALPPAPRPAAIEPPPAPEPVRFPTPTPTPPPPDGGDEIAELWETRVAAGDNPIVPGSTLGDDRVDLPFGYQWVVQLDPIGNITATRLRGLAEDIALRLGKDTNHVDIDRLQDGHARQDRALLTVITRDALAGGVDYPGPRYHDGLIPLGMFADGSGSPDWTARDNTGPQHGMVTGGTGSGKSELLTRLGMALKKSGEWTVVFTDGDEQGRSAPLLKRLAYDFGKGPAEQLEALEAWFHATGDIMGDYTEDADGNPVLMTDPDRQEPARKLMPNRGFSGWVWIIDEFHRLVKALGRDFADRVEALARIMRKVGGAIYIGTQSATLGDWGDNEFLRALMAAGNCVIMRTKNSTEQLVVGDFGCDPTTLPKGGGYGFVDDPDGRKMQFRGEYDKHMARWLSTLPQYRPAQIPALVYAAKRPPKPADPRADWEETQQRKAAILAAAETGGRFPWEPQPATGEHADGPPISPIGGDGVAAPGPPPPPGTARATGSDTNPQMIAALHFLAANTTSYAGQAEQLVAAYRAGALHEVTWQFAEEVIQRHGAPGLRPGDGPPTSPTPPSVPALTANAEQVRVMLRSRPGPWTTGELETATELSKSAVSKALGVLVGRGEAHRPTGKNGTYAAVEDVPEDVPAIADLAEQLIAGASS